jgi:hypothetical protein
MNVAEFLRRLYYIRFPVLCLLAVIGLGPIAARTSLQELLANTLLLHTFWQALALVLICLTASKLFLVQAGVILFNGPDRFSELQPAPQALPPATATALQIRWGWSPLKTLCWLAGGLTLPVTAIWYSVSNRAIGEKQLDELGGFSNTIGWTEGLSGLAIGLIVDLVLLVLVAFVERWLVSASATIPGLLPIRIDFPTQPGERLWTVDRWLARIIRGPGYTDPPDQNGEIYCRPGHWQQIVVLGFVIFAYLILRTITFESTARPEPPLLPTLFFAVLELALVSTVLTGASFYLDYYRIPTAVSLVLALALSFAYSKRDYTFSTPKTRHSASPPKLLDVVSANGRVIPPDKSGKRTLVVVTAPGGGIHAAAWTAQVLTGLHYRYGDEYARSVFLISAVSGGSVGTMYYAANFNVLQAPHLTDQEQLQNCRYIVENAAGSGLEAVGWGLVFQDLPAAVPLVQISGNRGTTLDECWQARLDIPTQQKPLGRFLSDWSKPIEGGRLPVVVFNATEVNSGRRTLFSPVYSQRRDSLDSKPESDAAPVEFTRTFGTEGYDVGIVTAARLSATFPYVTPTAKPDTLQQLGYMADGGYADNEGIETAVDWVDKIVEHFAEPDSDPLPFDRVLILRIRHQVPNDPAAHEDVELKTRPGDGFLFAAIGPIKAMLTVRGASQVERGQVEVDLLEGVPAAGGEPHRNITIESKFLDFAISDKDESPPLSWKLSPIQFLKYKAAWDDLIKGEVIDDLDQRYFKVQRR